MSHNIYLYLRIYYISVCMYIYIYIYIYPCMYMHPYVCAEDLCDVYKYHMGHPLPPLCRCVPPNGDATVTFDITPRSSFESEHALSITFQSDRLSGIMGCANVKITPRV